MGVEHVERNNAARSEHYEIETELIDTPAAIQRDAESLLFANLELIETADGILVITEI